MAKEKIIIGILGLMLFSGLVSGFAVAPGQKTFKYIPGMEESGRVRILNTNSESLYLVPSVEGPLSEFILFDDFPIEMEPSEKEAVFHYSIALDDSYFEPGVVETKILFSNSQKGDDIIKLSVSVPSMVRLMVPSEGKHPFSSIFVSDQPGDEIVFSIPVLNKGSDTIETVSVDLDIISDEKVVETLESGIFSLPSSEEKTFHLKWSPQAGGDYLASGKLYYDGLVMELSQNFSVVGIPAKKGFNKMKILGYIVIFALAVWILYQLFYRKKQKVIKS